LNRVVEEAHRNQVTKQKLGGKWRQNWHSKKGRVVADGWTAFWSKQFSTKIGTLHVLC